MKIRRQVQKLKGDTEMQHSDFTHLPAVLHAPPPKEGKTQYMIVEHKNSSKQNRLTDNKTLYI